MLKVKSIFIGGDLIQVYYCFIRLKENWVQTARLSHGDDLGDRLKEIVLSRWYFLHTSSMGFAYFLTPKSKTLSWDANDKAETMNELREFISLLYLDDVKTRECYAELSRYIILEIHNSPDLYNVFTNLRGLEYWIEYGRNGFPLLSNIAIQVLSVPTSSASAERVWSAYSFLWTKCRNRMNANTMEKLAFTYINHGLLDTKDPYDYFADEVDDFEDLEVVGQTEHQEDEENDNTVEYCL